MDVLEHWEIYCYCSAYVIIHEADSVNTVNTDNDVFMPNLLFMGTINLIVDMIRHLICFIYNATRRFLLNTYT